MKPQIIIGTFGLARAAILAADNAGRFVLDLDTRYLFRRHRCVYLRPSLFRMVLILGVIDGIVDHEQMEDQLWGDHIDGGPDNTRNAINAHLTHLRHCIAPLGVVIVNRFGRGWELCEAPP
jgi:DNA-binding response OmpR family regulator